MTDFKPTKYQLQSLKTGQLFNDSGWILDDPTTSEGGLIRTVYAERQLNVNQHLEGIYRFADWLPIRKMLKGSSAPVTFKSEGLAKHLGLENLFITFTGWWPEKGAFNHTCSFKETESYSVMARLADDEKRIMVVASAGNTAKAFAKVCSDNKIPLLLTLPEDNLDAMWFDEPIDECVKLVVSQSGSDYFDAIHLANLACLMPEFIAEGGAKNVARREGMGTTTLSAVTTIGQIPDFYFQAVGSGTGAIAAYEANLRLIEDGRFGKNLMKLMVSQNAPFIPIHNAWKQNSRLMLPLDDELARKQVAEIDAKVLSNRKPPYPVLGGLYDAMSHAGGDVLIATNDEAAKANEIFEQTEGNDLHPASAVATATLINAVRDGLVKPDDLIMLNITGGGEAKLKREHNGDLFYLKPLHVFEINPDFETVKTVLSNLFQFK